MPALPVRGERGLEGDAAERALDRHHAPRGELLAGGGGEFEEGPCRGLGAGGGLGAEKGCFEVSWAHGVEFMQAKQVYNS